MKIIKYEFYQTTLEDGKVITIPKEMPWSDLHEEIAKAEAYNGEYTIEDDGQPEPVVPPTPEDEISVWDELDAAYQEGVDSV